MNEYVIFKSFVAAKIGIEKAIMLCQLEYWIDRNIANEIHCHDGRWWTYNSCKAWETMLGGAMSENKIRRALKALKDDELIDTGNFNKNTFDKTTWFCITEKWYEILDRKDERQNKNEPKTAENCIRQNCNIDVTDLPNGSDEIDGPIPNINTNINTNINNNIYNTARARKGKFVPPSAEEVEAYCKERGFSHVNAEIFVSFYASKN